MNHTICVTMRRFFKCFGCIVPEPSDKNTSNINNIPIIINPIIPNNDILNISSHSSNSTSHSNDIIETIKPAKKYRKKNIPSTVKRLVWNTHIGEEIGKAKCLCCKVTDITQLSFHCGHIVAESNGGETTVANLKPICQNCNSSMGTTNMDDFMKKLI